MGSVMTIGIAGGTGSGKTTITRRLLQKFSSNVSVIYHDNYYKAHNDLNYEQRSLLNYDCPDAFDTELMLRDLKRLRAGRGDTLSGLRLHHPQPQRQDRDRAARAGHYRGGDPDF